MARAICKCRGSAEKIGWARSSATACGRCSRARAQTYANLEDEGIYTPARISAEVTAHYAARAAKPFTHIVVDEAQDLGVPELRLLSAIAPSGANRIFLAGDLG